MKDEIKELLEKLKDNIPIEEYRSEGTNDDLTHYEEDKNSWQYKLYNYITNLQEENQRLKEEIQRQSKALCINDKLLVNYRDRIDKAIEYLNEPNRDEFDYSITYLLEILQGGGDE